LSGRGLCDELITRPEESYRMCCVVVCDLETSRIGAPYIYDISRLRVKHTKELRPVSNYQLFHTGKFSQPQRHSRPSSQNSTPWYIWLRHCATTQKVVGLIPSGVLKIFYRNDPSGCILALGSTQPLTEMSTRNILWGLKLASARV